MRIEEREKDMLDHFKDMNKMQEVLHEAQTGLWVIELEEGTKPRMYADKSMLDLLGFTETPTPEICYEWWYNRIDEDYYPVVESAVERMAQDDRAEVQYPWQHPKWGRIYVRCGGVRDWNYKKGLCLRGYHQNITNTVMLKREYDTIIQTLSKSYTGIFLCNLQDKTYKAIKQSEVFRKLQMDFSDYEGFIKNYTIAEVAPQYQEAFLETAGIENIWRRIRSGEKQSEVLYRNRQGRWRRTKIMPSSEYSPEYPWVIIAFDEQDVEMEKKIDDTTTQIALSQIYKLVICLDFERLEYHCIHYNGELLHLLKHGNYEDFYQQLIKMMPLEDKKAFDNVFDNQCYDKKGYLEGVLRLWNKEREILHYYSYYAVRIFQDNEERIILMLRNIDDKQEAQQRENILSNLCQCYYSIYLFDLENNTEEAIWQEEVIRKRREFPKGSLDTYYSKFVREYVYKADQEKMYRAGSPDFLRYALSLEQPVYEIDFRRIYPDGLYWVRSRFSIAEIRDGEVTKVIFANMNINEQKLEEMEQEEQNRKVLLAAYEAAKTANEAKSSFLAQMSHDIRTPMNAIIGMSSIAASQINNPQKVKDCLEKINLSSKHLLALINEILDMSKIEKGKIALAEEPFCLSEVIEDISAMVRTEAAEKNHELTVIIKDIEHNVLIGDAGRIRQVLLNLISNAIKYTLNGGEILLTVQEVSGKISGYGSFVFTVEDNGIGMDEDFLDYIFVPFSRAEDPQVQKIQGTGLGMSISQKIVAAMQGNIQVESEKGKGSRFVVTLNLKIEEDHPDVIKKPAERADVQKQKSKAADKIKLLLVEDNSLNLEIAQTILEEKGYLVECAENGEEALKIFMQSEPYTYQLILMDLQMPVMDGYTAAREIRDCEHFQAKIIPIIALTANAFAEDMAKALAAGMNDYVSKPIDYNKLTDVIEKYMNQ